MAALSVMTAEAISAVVTKKCHSREYLRWSVSTCAENDPEQTPSRPGFWCAINVATDGRQIASGDSAASLRPDTCRDCQRDATLLWQRFPDRVSNGIRAIGVFPFLKAFKRVRLLTPVVPSRDSAGKRLSHR